MVNKNLFLYDLAVVAILKDEGHYLKEWLDYHLLAGVEHFYLYDNDSTDNQAEVAKPYVDAGLVDYVPAPGKVMQMPVYNDAVKRFKFQCRYMVFIDGDEFIYPKTNRSIVEVVDEILSGKQNAAGLAINWQCFGSNGQEKADYSRGLLERFTRRAPVDWAHARLDPKKPGANAHVKTILNPRRVCFISNPHFANYFEEFYSVNENNSIVLECFNIPVIASKIAINHYYVKSKEEFTKKVNRGRVTTSLKRTMSEFDFADRNEVFDDGILKYRAAREEFFSFEDEVHRLDRVSTALAETLHKYASGAIIENKLETALTCRALSTYMREKFPNDDYYWRICEEKSLVAILNSLNEMSLADFRLFMRELPKLLKLPYPAAREIHNATLQIIPQVKKAMRLNYMMKDFVELDNIQDLLKLTE